MFGILNKSQAVMLIALLLILGVVGSVGYGFVKNDGDILEQPAEVQLNTEGEVVAPGDLPAGE